MLKLLLKYRVRYDLSKLHRQNKLRYNAKYNGDRVKRDGLGQQRNENPEARRSRMKPGKTMDWRGGRCSKKSLGIENRNLKRWKVAKCSYGGKKLLDKVGMSVVEIEEEEEEYKFRFLLRNGPRRFKIPKGSNNEMNLVESENVKKKKK